MRTTTPDIPANCKFNTTKTEVVIEPTRKQARVSCKAAVGLTMPEFSILHQLFSFVTTALRNLQIECFEKGKKIKDFLSVSTLGLKNPTISKVFLLVFEVEYKTRFGRSVRAYIYNFYETNLSEEIMDFDKSHPWNNSFAIQKLSYGNALRAIYQSVYDEMCSNPHENMRNGKIAFAYSGLKIKEAYSHADSTLMLRKHYSEDVDAFLKLPQIEAMRAAELFKEINEAISQLRMSEASNTADPEQVEEDSLGGATASAAEVFNDNTLDESRSSEVLKTAELSEEKEEMPSQKRVSEVTETPIEKQVEEDELGISSEIAAKSFNDINNKLEKPSTSGNRPSSSIENIHLDVFEGLSEQQIKCEVFESFKFFRKSIFQDTVFQSQESQKNVHRFRKQRLQEIHDAEENDVADALRTAFYLYVCTEPYDDEAILACSFLEWVPSEKRSVYEMTIINALMNDEIFNLLSYGDEESQPHQSEPSTKQNKSKKNKAKHGKKGRK